MRGHGVETRAGIRLNVLDGLLQRAHGGVEFADGVAGLLDEGLHHGVILGHLGGEIFLALQQGGDVVLQFDNFARDGFGGPRTDKAPTDRSNQDDGTENRNVA